MRLIAKYEQNYVKDTTFNEITSLILRKVPEIKIWLLIQPIGHKVTDHSLDVKNRNDY